MTATTARSASLRAGMSNAQIVAATLCWLTVFLDGFDLVTLGAVIPTLTQTKALGFDTVAATWASTLSLVGVAIGSSTVGPIADRFGRRQSLVGSVALFSVMTIAQALAPTVVVFTGFRFIAGLGLGACLPTALTIMSEVTPSTHRAKATTMTMTGYHVGAVAASLLALAAQAHWQLLFYVGGPLGLLLAAVQWAMLPESRPREDSAAPLPASALLRPEFRRASLSTWTGAFMGLLLVYGLLTWLPQIMKSAGYSLDSSLVMLFIVNVGAVVGLVLAGWTGDRRGIKPAALVWFGLSAVFLTTLSVKIANTLLLDVAVFVTGVFTFSAMVLIYALVSSVYPSDIRGTAMGLTSGIGRLGSIVGPLVTGALVANGLAHPFGFYFFGAVAILGALALLAAPARPPLPLDGHGLPLADTAPPR